MRLSIVFAALGAACLSWIGAAPAESADAGRFFRLGGGPLKAFARQPRDFGPRIPLRPLGFKRVKPDRCRGSHRGCIEIGKVGGGSRDCPPGLIPRRGRCVPLVHSGSDRKIGDLVVIPDKACNGHRKRRGKGCVSVNPSSPPKIVIPDKPRLPDPPTKDAVPPRQPPTTIAKRVPAAVPPEIRALVAARPHRPREIVVLVASSGAGAVAIDLERRFSIAVEEQHAIALADGVLVRFRVVDNRPIERVMAALATDSRVMLVQPNYAFEASDAGVVHLTQPQYAPQKIRIPEAHVLTRGNGVNIAILDTGIDLKHPEIDGSIGATFDSLNEGPIAAEPHGTAITGIVSARSNLQGIAPEARILSVRAFASDGHGPPKSTSMALVKGIDWAFANKARLFNLSFAGPDDPLLARIIEAASEKGAIFVAAAGNGGPKAAPAYPAAYSRVIAVTATDDADRPFAMANQGAHVAIAAPGVDILAPSPGGRYDMSTGTSLAAAHVSGVIALMLEQDPSLSLADVRAILAKTARKIGNGDGARAVGAGLVDAAAATSAISSDPTSDRRTRAAAN